MSAASASPALGAASPPLPQPRSWSEALQQCQQQKHSAPALPHAPPARYLPANHPLHTDAIQPVTGQYKRRQREEAVRASEAAAEARRAQRLQHTPTRAYNIVTNQPSTAHHAASSPTAHSGTAEGGAGGVGRREYDIINHHAYYGDSEERLQGEERLALQRLRNHAAVKLHRERRDYDNIAHQYHSRHDEKQQAEADSNAHSLRSKYFQSHHYDPVVGQFCDPRKEAEWRRQRAAEEQNWGGRRNARHVDDGGALGETPQR